MRFRPLGNQPSDRPVELAGPAEQSLVAAVRAGDRDALETIYRAYWPALVRFARRFGGLSIDDAQELVQDVFLSLWRARAQWELRGPLARYLFGAVRNRVHEGRPLSLAQAADIYAVPTVDNSGEHRPILGELAAAVDAIVRGMPGRCRDVYTLRHLDHLDIHEIAAALNLSVITVKRHHARALHLLARALAETEWADALARVIVGTGYARHLEAPVEENP